MRCKFDGQAYFTIFAFFASTAVNLVYSLVEMTSDDTLISTIKIPQTVSDFVVVAVFYKVIYEMRVVRIKLECQEYKDYRRNLKVMRCVWTAFYLTLATVMATQIINEAYF